MPYLVKNDTGDLSRGMKSGKYQKPVTGFKTRDSGILGNSGVKPPEIPEARREDREYPRNTSGNSGAAFGNIPKNPEYSQKGQKSGGDHA